LEACDRSACGQVSPPQGLYLANVIYPDDPFKSEQVQPKPHEV
jgi:tRNA pseudouridine38-40 synthase